MEISTLYVSVDRLSNNSRCCHIRMASFCNRGNFVNTKLNKSMNLSTNNYYLYLPEIQKTNVYISFSQARNSAQNSRYNHSSLRFKRCKQRKRCRPV
ncbi:hypothetical protein DERP_014096 [Dermatophagoides pteronyssinus]|uniref:Uncharacterized protein n=1 Tax=Dermatophagoides pteronyssinus TaxID=6956 RepID=A0ABQ8J6C6_DERPT|nr:hypothetical protein DERP_014096 [Dermatophagoides pteronyssinus]